MLELRFAIHHRAASQKIEGGREKREGGSEGRERVASQETTYVKV